MKAGTGQSDVEPDEVDEDSWYITDGGSVPTSVSSLSSSYEVAQEQRNDASLIGCWKMAEKGVFLMKDNLLCHRSKILARMSSNLWCLRTVGLMF